jgi:threonine aldolase
VVYIALKKVMAIDFRSDTVTKPTTGMLSAMNKAKVGDDVFGEDPSINELENYAASLFNMESAIFCPSGTMTNQIAIKTHTQPGDEVICDESSHVYQYEAGGIAFNSGASVKLLTGNKGRITAEQVLNAINPEDLHKAKSSLVCLENTNNRGGGSCYEFEELIRIKKVCKENELKLHLDGARLFNAIVAKKETPKQYGKLFYIISICISKGLVGPVGS